MEKYFFLQSVHEKGRTRVKAIGNQIIPNALGDTKGTKVDTFFNVQCNYDDREKGKIGDIFYCENLYKTSGNFYRVQDGSIFLLKNLDDTLGKEIFEAYERVTGISEKPKKEQVTEPVKKEPVKLSLLDRLMRAPSMKAPDPVKEGFYVNSDIWYYLLRNLYLNKNTMLVGPTGTGKTELIQKLTSRTERVLRIFDMGAMQDPISGLLGVHRLEEGQSIFDQASFTKAVLQPDVILLDEISRAPSTANNILFPCLDSRRELPLELASSKVARSLKLNEECCFFATANLGSEYTGTQTLDRALIDRFSLVELEYMPKNIEADVLVKRVGIDKKEASLICDLASIIRDLYTKGSLSTGISTRHTLEIASLVRDGFRVAKSFELILFPMYEGNKTEGERSTLYSLLTSR